MSVRVNFFIYFYTSTPSALPRKRVPFYNLHVEPSFSWMLSASKVVFSFWVCRFSLQIRWSVWRLCWPSAKSPSRRTSRRRPCWRRWNRAWRRSWPRRKLNAPTCRRSWPACRQSMKFWRRKSKKKSFRWDLTNFLLSRFKTLNRKNKNSNLRVLESTFLAHFYFKSHRQKSGAGY